MNKRLTRIAPLKAGIVLGVLYALLACIMVPFMMLAGAGMAAAARSSGASIPMGFLFGVGSLFLPVIYGVMGFIIGVISAAVYNLVAKWTGGMEITLADTA
jgi:sulfite exporter TauE/SafE